jgi:hypothetical protein
MLVFTFEDKKGRKTRWFDVDKDLEFFASATTLTFLKNDFVEIAVYLDTNYEKWTQKKRLCIVIKQNYLPKYLL